MDRGLSYRFHAAAPPGEWINDPNALFFADGRYRLFVQHAADPPDFRRIGWGRLSSPDLLDWRWEGVVVPPEPDAAIYSGSLVAASGERQLFFTRHEPAGLRQSQRRATLDPDCAGAAVAPGAIGPAGRNVRDPFVFRADRGWRMLVARPCDWTDWRDDPPSTLELWGSPDLIHWRPLAVIGPWMEPGVMWEVPAVVDFGDVQALILSLVDRRRDAAECGVRYWLGRLDDAGFAPAVGFPPEGEPLDLGPDFYAAIPNVAEGWPTPERVLVGWASSWATARRLRWPEERRGGPISLPRTVELRDGRLRQRPIAAARAYRLRRFDVPPAPFRITIARSDARLSVRFEADETHIRREGGPAFDWERTHPVGGVGGPVELYVDGSLIELFHTGLALTAVLPGEGDPVITIA